MAWKSLKKYLVAHSNSDFRRVNIASIDEIKKYADLKKSFSKEIPELLFFNNLSDEDKTELCERLSFKIKRFTEFMRAFSVVDEDIKPIMLYYSINYFLTFLSDSLLRFSWREPHHGLGGKTNLTIQKEGAFTRIVDGFFALNKPTLFSPWKEKGIYAEKRELFGEIEEDINDRIHRESVEELYNKYEYIKKPKPQLSLSEIIDTRFILYEHWNKSKETYSSDKISYENLILVDYLLLFIAGSIARYNPTEWTKIQSAQDEHYQKIRYHINAAQANILNEWIPYLISEYVLPLELVNKLEVS